MNHEPSMLVCARHLWPLSFVSTSLSPRGIGGCCGIPPALGKRVVGPPRAPEGQKREGATGQTPGDSLGRTRAESSKARLVSKKWPQGTVDVIPGTPRLPAGRRKAGSRVVRQRRVPAFPDKRRPARTSAVLFSKGPGGNPDTPTAAGDAPRRIREGVRRPLKCP